jgi:hypothetical protein
MSSANVRLEMLMSQSSVKEYLEALVGRAENDEHFDMLLSDAEDVREYLVREIGGMDWDDTLIDVILCGGVAGGAALDHQPYSVAVGLFSLLGPITRAGRHMQRRAQARNSPLAYAALAKATLRPRSAEAILR